MIRTVLTGLSSRFKLVDRGRIRELPEARPKAQYSVSSLISGLFLRYCAACATQNEIDKTSAEKLVANGCTAIGEGANMPSTPEAVVVYLKNKLIYGPAKAANAGGVATSALEMSQNSMRYSWSFDEVDAKLKQIMIDIYKTVSQAAAAYGDPDNLMLGANIAGFEKVATAMYQQGVAY